MHHLSVRVCLVGAVFKLVYLVAILVLNLCKTCFHLLPAENTANRPGLTEYCGMNQRKRKTQFDWSVTRHSKLTKQAITDPLVLHFWSI